MINIFKILSSTKGLSVEDCSVWYHAKKHRGVLLTGDAKLRKHSLADGVEVRGILFVFDLLLISGFITFEMAIKKLNQLYLFNSRLPIDPKNKRLDCWAISKHVSY